MMRQLQIPDWGLWVGVFAFFVTFAVFAVMVLHTLRMTGKKVEQLENLPWADDPKP